VRREVINARIWRLVAALVPMFNALSAPSRRLDLDTDRPARHPLTLQTPARLPRCGLTNRLALAVTAIVYSRCEI
jgi:hypothetical protein